MSYRLINSNALAMNYAEVNDLPCIYADLPNGLDGGYYNLARGNADKSRWFELFGTPERAARTWIEYKGNRCADCPICHDERGVTCEIPGGCVWVDEEHGYDMLLEWLESEVRDD